MLRRMKRLASIGYLLLSGCFSGPLDFDSPGPQLEVCVESDAGRCCLIKGDLCTAIDTGCKVGGPAPRPPTQCLPCWPYQLQDGQASRTGPTVPPNPPPDSGVYIQPDGAVHDPRIEVCGPAEYERY